MWLTVVDWMSCNVDESSDKRLEHEVQRYRDLLDEANQQISSMSNGIEIVFNHWRTTIIWLRKGSASCCPFCRHSFSDAELQGYVVKLLVFKNVRWLSLCIEIFQFREKFVKLTAL